MSNGNNSNYHNHIEKIFYYEDAKDVFPNVEIKGGVNYFLFRKGYSGLVDFYNCKLEKRELQKRNLFEKGVDIIINDGFLYPILQKVKNLNFISLTSITTGRNTFNIIGKEDVLYRISKEKQEKNLCPIRCKNNIIRWIDPNIITKNRDIFESYKVFISKSAGSPNKDLKVIGYPYIGEPYSACTDSLFAIGKFKTLDEANNLSKYIKTKFLRFMVSISKSSQNVTQIVYQFVPLQDFTNKSDIDWNMSIHDIDKQLYKKYGFTEEEIEFIESKIKSME